MKIELATAHQILVELDRADLCAYRLTVEQLDAMRENTRQILQRILLAAADETGHVYRLRQYSNVDVLPDKTGGCLLIISDYEKRRQPAALCFETERYDALVDLARAAGAQGREIPVTLLQLRQRFFLLAPPLHGNTRRLFAEYLQPLPMPYDAQWVLREHARVLLAHAPLSALGGGS